MIQVYYGDGKGKTTAAIGQAIRASGAGMRVAFVQFLKPNTSSEITVLEGLENIDVYSITTSTKFLWEIKDLTIIKAEVERGINLVRDMVKGDFTKEYDLIVLDEVLHLVINDFISERELMDIVLDADYGIEFVLTGSVASKFICDLADTVTCMNKVKHCYDSGIRARRGIEF